MKDKLSDLIEVKEFDLEDENLILNYTIMNDDFAKYIYSKYKQGQIKTKYFTPYLQTVFRWLIVYIGEYKKAPKKTMQHLYNFYSKSLTDEKREVISIFLERLSEEFVKQDEDGIDIEWLKKEIVPKFVLKQEALLKKKNIQLALDHNDNELLEKTLSSVNKITNEELEDEDLGTSKPGSLKSVKKYYTKEKDKNAMFKLNGPIGDFIGPIYRGKLYAATGIEKSKKSFIMQEIGLFGVQFHKLKCLDINLEMLKEDKEERFWQRISGMAVDKEHSGRIIYPIFDCENNQFGSCQIRKTKLNKKDLLSSMDDLVSFEERRDWKICQKCRFKKTRKNAVSSKRFIPAIWFNESRIRQITEPRITRIIKAKQPYGIGNYRIKCFPRFSATLEEITNFIYKYIELKKFHPDILIIDYPDITAPIEGKLMDRQNINYNWEKIAGLSQELNCAILVADQAIKAERNRRSLSTMCTSESKTKDAHLDMRITLNSTEIEYELGIQRIGMLFRRKGRLLNSEIMITQRLETANVILDSEWWNNRNTYYPVTKYR